MDTGGLDGGILLKKLPPWSPVHYSAAPTSPTKNQFLSVHPELLQCCSLPFSLPLQVPSNKHVKKWRNNGNMKIQRPGAFVCLGYDSCPWEEVVFPSWSFLNPGKPAAVTYWGKLSLNKGVWVCCCCCLVLSHVWLFGTPWTLSMGFSRQEYWSGLPWVC